MSQNKYPKMNVSISVYRINRPEAGYVGGCMYIYICICIYFCVNVGSASSSLSVANVAKRLVLYILTFARASTITASIPFDST